MSDPFSGTRNHVELPYADLPTFGKAPHTSLDELTGVDVAVFGVPWDATASPRPGARFGPRRIREETQAFRDVWNPAGPRMVPANNPAATSRDRIRMVDCGDAAIFPFDLARTVDSVRRVSAALAEHAFPIMLGGDHYVMYPAYQGVCDAFRGFRVGIVQIDAHDDAADDDPVLGRHWCGTPIRRALEHSRISPRSVAMVGLRGFIDEDLARRQSEEGFVVVRMEEARRKGPKAIAEHVMTSVLEHCDRVYLTVDIDAVDPSFAPGCGSPCPGGFVSHEFLELIAELGRYEEVVALDLVEVAPPLDPTEQTPLLAAHALFRYIDARFMRTRV